MLPTFQFDWRKFLGPEQEEVTGVVNDNLIEGQTVPNDEVWVVWAASVHANQASTRVTLFVERAAETFAATAVASVQASAANQEIFLDRVIVLPPGYRMGAFTEGLPAGAQMQMQVQWMRFSLPRPGVESGTIETGIGRKPRFRFQL